MTTAKKKRGTFLIIVLTGFLSATLDALAAIIWTLNASPALIFKYIANGVFGKVAIIVFQSIASGAFGKDVATKDPSMAWWGVLFHYIIAYSFTAAFYLSYPFMYKISKNKYAIGLIYGMITWIIMNLFVVPLSKIGFKPFLHVWPVVIGLCMLILCIGMPVAIVADWQRRKELLSRKS